MTTFTNWPIDKAIVRKALLYTEDQGDDVELQLYADCAWQAVDRETGRHLVGQELRHVIVSGTEEEPVYTLPAQFVLAARVAAKLWWDQDHTTPGAKTNNPPVPMGADLPAKAKAWLKNYPPPPGIA